MIHHLLMCHSSKAPSVANAALCAPQMKQQSVLELRSSVASSVQLPMPQRSFL
ncbi:uncharacterized protein PITG_08413 [Phytophthora infestans T30-4]|uniref:Uncharacterized protein n=1 Tax=Phytophthora infestans (strain T30-4) TaxID=403677 RepID=D0NAJ4_PHYIT|nr:uncharacterized protein PITG_08413 [Phytophthora infestans T30-4]EEY54852.1 hypothetical protein PITG_08413 [Phytophthora infestans T30-4]|eukprot:XP_002903797.1 hypothetical protein PITG_08413 [Phytophthora infestans T30-4]